MKKRAYEIVFPQEDKTVKYKEVEGYTQRLYLSNGLSITIGLRKENNYWHTDDYLTGMAITNRTFKTRKEAITEAKQYLELQKDKIREAREYYVNNFNIKLNCL
jgi:hypothetical protein